MTDAEQTERIIGFLREIGIPVSIGTIDTDTFLPGILIQGGGMLVDPAKLTYPGDLLHEAGHIAVMMPEDREQLAGDAAKGGMGDEIVAILWSFAAAQKINLPEEIIFHPGGYKGASAWYIDQFRNQQNYIGLPLLEWMGLTASPAKAQTLGVPPFPHMLQWLRS